MRAFKLTDAMILQYLKAEWKLGTQEKDRIPAAAVAYPGYNGMSEDEWINYCMVENEKNLYNAKAIKSNGKHLRQHITLNYYNFTQQFIEAGVDWRDVDVEEVDW